MPGKELCFQRSGMEIGGSVSIEYFECSAAMLEEDLVPATDVQGYMQAAIHIFTAASGTVSFLGSNDGSDFVPIGAIPAAGGAMVTTTTTTGAWIIPLFMKFLKVQQQKWTSGTTTATIRFSTTPITPTSPATITRTELSAGALNADFLSVVDVGMYSQATVQVGGPFVGTLTFQGSLDGVTWYSVPAVSVAGGPLVTTVTVVGIWIIPISFNWLRIRMTAWSSGTATGFLRASTSTLPLDALITSVSLAAGSAAIAIGLVAPAIPATPYIVNSAASTNSALILTGTSGLQALYATNIGATAAYVKLFNKATAPVVGTDVPAVIIPVPAAVAGVPGVAQITPGFSGYRFLLGLGMAITGAAADADTTAVAAGQVKVILSRTV